MATVYLANDVKHDREVAIKVLHPELAASLGAERFEREIRLAAKLQHPHILGLHDSGVAGDLLYYVMPFVKGESLRDRLDREGMLPVEDAVAIALEVNDALGYAHAQGVVHRDIKPENILLSGGHALVADFGIARAIVRRRAAPEAHGDRHVDGHAVYMAPEQASGEVVGPTADLYSLGCMLYEMLAGEPPFTRQERHADHGAARHGAGAEHPHRPQRRAARKSKRRSSPRLAKCRPIVRRRAAAVRGAHGAHAWRHVEHAGAHDGDAPHADGPVAARQHADVRGAAAPPWRRRPVASWARWHRSSLRVGAFAIWRGPSRTSRRRFGPDAHRIAVLYFDDQSNDHSLGAVADGLTEDLIRSLSTAPSLTVISRSGVERVSRLRRSRPTASRARCAPAISCAARSSRTAIEFA